MARSFKKKNYLKDGGTKRSKFYKTLSHKRLRQETTRRILKEEWETMPLNREMTNQWDVCDWKSYYDEFESRIVLRQKTIENEHILLRWENWAYYYYQFRWHPRVKWFKGHYRFSK
jgi:hypothetical protein